MIILHSLQGLVGLGWDLGWDSLGCFRESYFGVQRTKQRVALARSGTNREKLRSIVLARNSINVLERLRAHLESP